MSFQLRRASVIAVVATLITALFSAGGSGAIAQATDPAAAKSEPASRYIAEPVVQPLAQADSDALAAPEPEAEDGARESAGSLAELVDAQPQVDELPRELNCLAGAIYFEAKSESLAGQLAVGRVIVARARSGRFPDSYCGVVFQRSQFSFVRGSGFPAINSQSRFWRNAVAIAQIADAGSWRSPVEGALFFHAARVSPGWRLTRMARVDNHVFYR